MSADRELESLSLLEQVEQTESGPALDADADASASSSGFATDDFLYHLYRGSELLKDSRVGEAKEELERALSLQPRDVEGQGLLGVVYFRLGLYPRAIAIYEEIVAAQPSEITPRQNLGLCYLKTGQLLRARDVLTELVELSPGHQRAWGYLGLSLQRLGELERAAEAFDHAGQPHMAERMLRELRQLRGADEREADDTPEREAVREVAAEAVQELERAEPRFARDEAGAGQPAISGRWLPVELGEEPLPPSRGARPRPQLVDDLSEAGSPSSAGPAEEPQSVHSPRAFLDLARLGVAEGQRLRRLSPRTALLQLDGAFVVRPEHVRACQPHGPPLVVSAVRRRFQRQEREEALGGTRPFKSLHGSASLTLAAAPRLVVVRLDREIFFAREDHLVGFDAALAHESAALPLGAADRLPVVQLSGTGLLLLRVGESLTSVEAPVLVRVSDIVGWIGRLIAQPAPPGGDLGPGLTRFEGQGAVLLDPS